LNEVEVRLDNLTHAAQLAEDQREDEFRAHEEDRDRIFRQGEERRTEEARARTEAIIQELDNRLAAAPGPFEPPASPFELPAHPSEPPVHPSEPPVHPSEPPVHPSEPPVHPFEPPVRPFEHPAEPEIVLLESDAASIHSRATAQLVSEVLDTVRAEREQFEREREEHAAEHAAERERLALEAAAVRTRLEEEREMRIKGLEDELAAVRAELENEKQQRQTMEAEQREQESRALLERDEAVQNQLGDLTNLVQEQRDAIEQKRTMMDIRHDEKKHRQAEKDSKWSDLAEMVRKLAEDMTETKEMAIAAKIESGQNPSKHSKLVIIIAFKLLRL